MQAGARVWYWSAANSLCPNSLNRVNVRVVVRHSLFCCTRYLAVPAIPWCQLSAVTAICGDSCLKYQLPAVTVICGERACPALGGEAAPNQATRCCLTLGGALMGGRFAARRGASPLTTEARS